MHMNDCGSDISIFPPMCLKFKVPDPSSFHNCPLANAAVGGWCQSLFKPFRKLLFLCQYIFVTDYIYRALYFLSWVFYHIANISLFFIVILILLLSSFNHFLCLLKEVWSCMYLSHVTHLFSHASKRMYAFVLRYIHCYNSLFCS